MLVAEFLLIENFEKVKFTFFILSVWYCKIY